jgi:hypothetical protein
MGLLDDLRKASAENSEHTGDGSQYAESWRWEHEGDGIEGVVISVSERTNENHPQGYPIVTVRQPDGTDKAIHGLTYVLKDEIVKRGIRPGDQIAVLYRGKKMSSNGRGFHDFAVSSVSGHGAPPPAANPVPAPAAAQSPWDTPGSVSAPPPF